MEPQSLVGPQRRANFSSTISFLGVFLETKNFYTDKEQRQKIHKGQSGVSCVSKLLPVEEQCL